jgi:hypothetical protein
MNCLAHAFRFVDNPYYAAGTCLPDWLGMVDRKVRLRRKTIEPHLAEASTPSPFREIASGIYQHLHDDETFHNSLAFNELNAILAKEFRKQLPDDDRHRPAFVGHIIVELFLDAWIETRNPGSLNRYYECLKQVDSQLLEQGVNQLATKATTKISEFLPKYLNSRFLFDYLDDQRLLHRLNGILRRVDLEPLPDACLATIATTRPLVYERAEELLNEVERTPSAYRLA